MITNTASLCQILGGLVEQISEYDAIALEGRSFLRDYMARKKSERKIL